MAGGTRVVDAGVDTFAEVSLVELSIFEGLGVEYKNIGKEELLGIDKKSIWSP